MSRPKDPRDHPPPEQLPELSRRRIQKYCQREDYIPASMASGRRLRLLWADCRDYYLGKGLERVDWEAVFRKWIRSEVSIQNERAHARRREHPQEQGERRADPEPLAEVLDMFRKPGG